MTEIENKKLKFLVKKIEKGTFSIFCFCKILYFEQKNYYTKCTLIATELLCEAVNLKCPAIASFLYRAGGKAVISVGGKTALCGIDKPIQYLLPQQSAADTL